MFSLMHIGQYRLANVNCTSYVNKPGDQRLTQQINGRRRYPYSPTLYTKQNKHTHTLVGLKRRADRLTRV